jgi:TonB family protein
MGWKPMPLFAKISAGRVSDLTKGEMTNQAQALIYHRPSKWPIATTLATAVLIHLSAVAIAFHRELLTTPVEPVTDSIPFGFDPESDPPIPPDPDISVPLPPPLSTAEFIEPEEVRRSTTTQRTPPPIRRPGQTHPPTVGNAKSFVVSAPRPDYPYEARSRHITGSGIAIISVDPVTGFVTGVTMEQSIGNPILDNSTASAFRRWRFKTGSPSRVRIPITFLLTGAQY